MYAEIVWFTVSLFLLKKSCFLTVEDKFINISEAQDIIIMISDLEKTGEKKIKKKSIILYLL